MQEGSRGKPDGRVVAVVLVVRLEVGEGSKKRKMRVRMETGKAHLACMIVKVIGTLREQHRETFVAHHKWHEYRRNPRVVELFPTRIRRLRRP